MSAIETLLRQPGPQAIAWALLQFVWQGAVIGALTAAVLAALRRSAADVRYVVAAISLSLMLTMPVVTAIQAWPSSTTPGETSNANTPAATTQSSYTPPVTVSPAEPGQDCAIEPCMAAAVNATNARLGRPRVEPWLPVLLLVWVSGVMLLTLRLMSGWWWVQRMKTHGAATARDSWHQMAIRLSRRLHIRRGVRLLESTVVDVPTVIGWLRPVILLPASALSGLTPQQLEAILAHELAHIRRHDYLVNLLQTLVETLLFYHPAVWWLSRQIRIERENCCDDLAVSLCGDPYTYAQALADLEELRGPGGLVIAANGGSLLLRVRRLLGAPSHAGRGPGWLAGMVAVLLMAGIAAGAMGRDLITDGQGSAGQSPSTPTVPQSAGQAPAIPDVSVAITEAEIASLIDLSEFARAQAEFAGLDFSEFARAQAEFAGLDFSKLAFAQAELAGLDFSKLAFAQAELAGLDATQLWPLPPWPPLPPEPPSPPEPPAFASGPSWPSLPSFPSSPSLPSPASLPSEPSLASQPSLPAPPSLPSSPSMPSPPSPPSPPSASIEGNLSFSGNGQSHGNFTWSNGTTKLQVSYSGDIEFSDDDTDVVKLSPGGWLKIKDGGWFGARTVEFRADGSGDIQRRFWVGASEKPFEPEGRQWLAQALPKFIRQTGIGAPRRVARILKAKGPSGVLAEISLIEGSWAKRTYFGELFKTATLDSATVRTALAQAGTEIDSDFELASLLISAHGLLTDDGTRKAYFEAARGIDSDFEMRRVYSSALKQGAVSPAILAALLDASTAIESDFEEASLLAQVAKLQPLDAAARAPFFRALGTVASDFEHRRVLTALAQRTDLPPEVIAAMLESAAAIDSDFEAASLLIQIAQTHALDSALRPAFFRAVENVESSFERGRILQSIVKQPDVPAETILAVLRAASATGGSFETSQVLLAVAARHSLTGPARDAYLDAAEKLGSFEQGQVLTALVKNERRQ